MKSIRLRWKKNPRETGLAAVGAGPRGSFLHDGAHEYARVYAYGGGWRPFHGWYWVTNPDFVGVLVNTCDRLVATEEEAKEQAMKFVKERLATKDKE